MNFFQCADAGAENANPEHVAINGVWHDLVQSGAVVTGIDEAIGARTWHRGTEEFEEGGLADADVEAVNPCPVEVGCLVVGIAGNQGGKGPHIGFFVEGSEVEEAIAIGTKHIDVFKGAGDEVDHGGFAYGRGGWVGHDLSASLSPAR